MAQAEDGSLWHMDGAARAVLCSVGSLDRDDQMLGDGGHRQLPPQVIASDRLEVAVAEQAPGAEWLKPGLECDRIDGGVSLVLARSGGLRCVPKGCAFPRCAGCIRRLFLGGNCELRLPGWFGTADLDRPRRGRLH